MTGDHSDDDIQSSDVPASDTQASGIRASDAEREEVVARLREGCAEGRLTLEDLTARSEVAYRAVTRSELARLTEDLPASAVPATDSAARPAPRRGAAPSGRWRGRVLAILGDVKRAGEWWPEDPLAAIAVLGDVKLDLYEAHVPAEGLTITATAVLGDVIIVVPEGVRVEMSGSAVLGDKTVDVASPPSGTSAPTIRVRGYAILGDVRVTDV